MSAHFPLVCTICSNDLYIIDDATLNQWSTQNNPSSYFSSKPGVIPDLHTFSVCLQVQHLSEFFYSSNLGVFLRGNIINKTASYCLKNINNNV